jgi:GT2 family glycosyltransferase
MCLTKHNVLPLISAVMVVYARSDLLPIVMANLALQTIAPAMEIILVAESREALRPTLGNSHPFFSLRIVEALDIRETGQAKALGVEAARAPLVMFVEDHSFPTPDCAEAMVRRHAAQKLAAVGPVMLNANPSSAISWGTFLVFYGQWTGKNLRPRVHHLPANHSC